MNFLHSFKLTDVLVEVHLIFWHDVVAAESHRLVLLILVIRFVEIVQNDGASVN